MKYFEKSREVIKLDKTDIGVGGETPAQAGSVKKYLREPETGKGMCQETVKMRELSKT